MSSAANKHKSWSRVRDYSTNKANLPITKIELREIIDFRCRGWTFKKIAEKFERKTIAIRNLYNDIISNYSEDGKRKSIEDRLLIASCRSTLDYNRTKFNSKEEQLLDDMLMRGMSLRYIQLVMYLPVKSLVRLRARKGEIMNLVQVLKDKGRLV